MITFSESQLPFVITGAVLVIYFLFIFTIGRKTEGEYAGIVAGITGGAAGGAFVCIVVIINMILSHFGITIIRVAIG